MRDAALGFFRLPLSFAKPDAFASDGFAGSRRYFDASGKVPCGDHEAGSRPSRTDDFAAGVPTPLVSYTARSPLGGVTLSRCFFPPNPGVTLGAKQAIVAVHSGPPFELEWRDPSRDALQQTTIKSAEMYVNSADLPVFHRWFVSASALIIALDTSFVDLVVPILQARGLFRTEYDGTTLRDHLGLERPDNPRFRDVG